VGSLRTLTAASLALGQECTTGYPTVESALPRPQRGQASLHKVKVLNYIETVRKKKKEKKPTLPQVS
jgi:hypothetical protein